MKGLAEALRRTYDQYNIKTYFKPTNTIRSIIGNPKDKSKKEETCGPVYHIQCKGSEEGDCGLGYIGETARALKSRFAEHQRRSSTSSEVSNHIHRDRPGHQVKITDVKILDRDPRWFERGVKEAIQIRKHKPALNKDGGRHNLSHLWDSLIA